MIGGGLDEVGQLIGPDDEILDIEHSHGDSAEEAGHAALEDFPPGAQQVSVGSQGARQRNEVVLAAPCTVKDQQGYICAL